jgi:hypothetical protein
VSRVSSAYVIENQRLIRAVAAPRGCRVSRVSTHLSDWNKSTYSTSDRTGGAPQVARVSIALIPLKLKGLRKPRLHPGLQGLPKWG